MSGGQKLSIRNSAFRNQNSGQALVETALIVPFLLMIALNVVNFGYFFLVAVNLAAAPRSGALYSILGGETPTQGAALPLAGPTGTTTTVSYLSLNDMAGALHNGGSAGIQVCSSTVGLANQGTTSQISQCSQYNGSPAYTVDTDPEAPSFILNRVDITYTFAPLIPGTPFNIVLLASPICTSAGGVTCTFHRMAEMREMN